jgi:hypothetical protein
MKRTLNVLSLNDLIQLLYKFNNTKERLYYRFREPDYNKLKLEFTILTSDFEYDFDFENNVFIINSKHDELHKNSHKLDEFLNSKYKASKVIDSVEDDTKQIKKFFQRFQEYLGYCENHRLNIIEETKIQINELDAQKRLVNSIKSLGRITDYGYQKINLFYNDNFLNLNNVIINLYVLDDICELEIIKDDKKIAIKDFSISSVSVVDYVKDLFNKKYISLTNYYQNKIDLCNLFQDKINNSRNAIQTNFLEFLI